MFPADEIFMSGIVKKTENAKKFNSSHTVSFINIGVEEEIDL